MADSAPSSVARCFSRRGWVKGDLQAIAGNIGAGGMVVAHRRRFGDLSSGKRQSYY
jgi:hypothetical protein